MRILYLSSAERCDYLCDMLFHGLRTMLGQDVVDINPLWYMYASSFGEGKKQLSDLYGKGFTLYGLLPDCEVDRTDIENKIRTRYFDLVVFGSIVRDYQSLGPVLSHYPKSRIVMLDGEDDPSYWPDVAKLGIFFKREVHNPHANVHPIQFSIPKEKISGSGVKTMFMAPLDPIDTRTYIYKTEHSYYQQYRASLFAKTQKKAGWDCLRHYEIMACGCIPYFRGIECCPPELMKDLPKAELLLVKQLVDYEDGMVFRSDAGRDLWSSIMAKLEKVLMEKLTTEALAKKVLDTVNREA